MTANVVSVEETVERHLRLALDAEDPQEKDYHVRNALQAELMRRARRH